MINTVAETTLQSEMFACDGNSTTSSSKPKSNLFNSNFNLGVIKYEKALEGNTLGIFQLRSDHGVNFPLYEKRGEKCIYIIRMPFSNSLFLGNVVFHK